MLSYLQYTVILVIDLNYFLVNYATKYVVVNILLSAQDDILTRSKLFSGISYKGFVLVCTVPYILYKYSKMTCHLPFDT